VAGIDVDGTLRRLGVPFESLRAMLGRFAESQQKTMRDLSQAVEKADCQEVRRQAHALSGAAGNLGAVELHEAAKALETAAREGRTDLADLFREVQRRADVAFSSIGNLPEPTDGQRYSAPSNADAPIKFAQIRTLLGRLRTVLADFDHSGSMEALQEIARLQLPDELRRQTARVQRDIDGYDYGRALDSVDQWLAGLPEDKP
jgi:HPt (histidine-containing phosphotransfer) domain-containing protein